MNLVFFFFFLFFAVVPLVYLRRSTLADRFLFCLHGSTARAFQDIMFLYAVFALRLLSQLRQKLRLLEVNIVTFSHCSPLMGRLKLRKKNAALKKNFRFQVDQSFQYACLNTAPALLRSKKKTQQEIFLKIEGLLKKIVSKSILY